MPTNSEEIRDNVLEAFEASLSAQLRAIRKLRRKDDLETSNDIKSMSQIDMAYDILKKSRRPLHVTELISRIKDAYDIEIDRESIVSALTKKVVKGKQFVRTDRNTFGAK